MTTTGKVSSLTTGLPNLYTKMVIVPVHQIGNFTALCNEAKIEIGKEVVRTKGRARIYRINIPAEALQKLLEDFEAIMCDITETSL